MISNEYDRYGDMLVLRYGENLLRILLTNHELVEIFDKLHNCSHNQCHIKGFNHYNVLHAVWQVQILRASMVFLGHFVLEYCPEVVYEGSCSLELVLW